MPIAQDQRPHAERIAHADQRLVVEQRDQRLGALDLLQRVDQPVDDGRYGCARSDG